MSATFRDLRRDNYQKYVWYNGNCLELLSEIPDSSVQLVVTSPPYSVGKEYERGTYLSENISLQEKVIEECFRVLKPAGSICWQVGNTISHVRTKEGREVAEITPLDVIVCKFFWRLGMKMRNRIIWHYEHGTHATHRFSNRYETLMWFSKTDDYHFDLDAVRIPQKWPKKKSYKGPNRGKFSCNPLGKNPGDVWAITNIKNNHPEKLNGGHPCQFPLDLVRRCIRSLSKPGEWVLDPFGGVATTLIAAVSEGRVGLSSEIERKYHRLGQNRINAVLGKSREGRSRISPEASP